MDKHNQRHTVMRWAWPATSCKCLCVWNDSSRWLLSIYGSLNSANFDKKQHCFRVLAFEPRYHKRFVPCRCGRCFLLGFTVHQPRQSPRGSSETADSKGPQEYIFLFGLDCYHALNCPWLQATRARHGLAHFVWAVQSWIHKLLCWSTSMWYDLIERGKRMPSLQPWSLSLCEEWESFLKVGPSRMLPPQMWQSLCRLIYGLLS